MPRRCSIRFSKVFGGVSTLWLQIIGCFDTLLDNESFYMTENSDTGASIKPNRSLVFWSTTETVQKEVPSITAIFETLLAVPVYWWFAVKVGIILPLLIGAAVAPFVLLRSDRSVEKGMAWFGRYTDCLFNKARPRYTGSRRTIGVWLLAILTLALTISVHWLIFRTESRKVGRC
jgi:hypothetical protein